MSDDGRDQCLPCIERMIEYRNDYIELQMCYYQAALGFVTGARDVDPGARLSRTALYGPLGHTLAPENRTRLQQATGTVYRQSSSVEPVHPNWTSSVSGRAAVDSDNDDGKDSQNTLRQDRKSVV